VLHKSLWLLALAILVFIAGLSIGCGSSSNLIMPCTGSYNLVGPWQITVTTSSGTVKGYGAIDSAGLALFFDNAQPASTGDTLQMPTLTGACSFSGNVTEYSEPGGPRSGVVLTDAVGGNVTSSTAISGTLTGSPTGTISVASFSPLTGAVTAVSGAKTGAVQGAFNGQPVLLALTFTPSGTSNNMNFATTNLAGCEANGTFTQQSTSNVFDVSITLMPTCPMTGTFTGVGFESSSDYFNLNGGNADTYLYADILNGSNTFVMEIF
jgi:hypothetical protein